MTSAEVRASRLAQALDRIRSLLSDLLGYGLVSAAALACDCALLVLLVREGLGYLAAALMSFSAGMVVAYALSIRFVFADRRLVDWRAEAFGFFAIGIVGLLLTQILLYAFVGWLGWGLAVAKSMTVGLVFLFNFVGRRHLVFAGEAGR